MANRDISQSSGREAEALSVVCHRQKYIDEQMEKRMGVKKEDPRARKGPMDPEQQLYVTPDELKVRMPNDCEYCTKARVKQNDWYGG